MAKKEMYVLKEPRQRAGQKEGESKTVWNRVGVMFKNKASEDGKESFDILFDAHPIGERIRAFTADAKTSEDTATIS